MTAPFPADEVGALFAPLQRALAEAHALAMTDAYAASVAIDDEWQQFLDVTERRNANRI